MAEFAALGELHDEQTGFGAVVHWVQFDPSVVNEGGSVLQSRQAQLSPECFELWLGQGLICQI